MTLDQHAASRQATGAVESVALSIIVVTYRSRASIAACLAALPSAAGPLRLEVVVVDNASDDGTADMVESEFPGAVVVRSDENLGFAAANNLGLEAARGDAVCFLNPDTEAAPGSLARLCRTLWSDPTAAVVAPQLLNTDGSDQRTARRFPGLAAAVVGRRSPLSRLWPSNPWTSRYLAIDLRRDGPYPVDWVSGACMVMHRQEALDSGGFDPGFFLYWEDADWCRRLARAGRRVVCDPAAVVVHHEGATKRVSARQVVAFHRSAYRYTAKHHLSGPARLLRPAAAGALATRAGLVLARRAVAGVAPIGPALATSSAPAPGPAPRLEDDGPVAIGTVPTERAQVARRMAVSITLQAGTKVAHLGLNVVSSLAVIRYLAPSAYGNYVLIVALLTLLGMLADFGITKLAVREVSNDERSEGDIVGTIVVVRLALSAAAAAGIQGALIALHRSADVRMAAGVASLSLVGTSLLSVVASFEVRLRQYLESIVVVAGEAVETTLIVVFVVQRRPLADLFAATVIGTSLAAALALAVVLVRYRVVPRFDRRRVVALLRSAAPLAAVGLVGITLVKLDSIMLAAFRSSREVGLYGAAYQPVEYILIGAVTFAATMLPLLTRFARTDQSRLQVLYARGTEATLAVIVPVCLLVIGVAAPPYTSPTTASMTPPSR